RPLLKNEKAVEEGAKWGSMFASIMAGGTAIIPPLMALENKKVKKSVIRRLDEKIYGKETVENDPKFEESYCRIDEEPKKGFVTGMAARMIAIAPLITVASLPATNKPLIKYMYDPIGRGSKWLVGKIGIKPGKMLAEGAMERIEGDPGIPKKFQSNWDFLHRTIGFDFGLTIFYSIFHEIAYKALAALGVEKEELHIESAIAGPSAPAPPCPPPFAPHQKLAPPPASYTEKLAAEERGAPIQPGVSA
ncbi:MAG: hypothetical protein KGJ21_08840, partial [Pseudomonadota bacterium]|nr:hypothetical protein [Pseudomonadota bacterium]